MLNQLVVLGNCAMQSAERETTSFACRMGGRTVVLDTGPAVVRQLIRAGIGVTEIDTIVLTHSHGDHVAGFPYLMFAIYAARLRETEKDSHTVRVLAPQETFDGVMAAFKFMYPPGEYNNFSLDHVVASLEEQDSYQIGSELRITSVPVSHAVPTIGVRLDSSAGRSLTYSSDTIFDERLVSLAQNTEVLIHEAFAPSSLAHMAAPGQHATAMEAGRAGFEASARRLLLAHAIPAVWDDPAELLAEASAAFMQEAELPDDLTIVDF